MLGSNAAPLLHAFALPGLACPAYPGLFFARPLQGVVGQTFSFSLGSLVVASCNQWAVEL